MRNPPIAAETFSEQIPRIFPRNEAHVRATFCGDLQRAIPADERKVFDLLGNRWRAL